MPLPRRNFIFDYKGSQEVGIIKGVDDDFMKVTGLDTSLITGAAKFGQETEFGILVRA